MQQSKQWFWKQSLPALQSPQWTVRVKQSKAMTSPQLALKSFWQTCASLSGTHASPPLLLALLPPLLDDELLEELEELDELELEELAELALFPPLELALPPLLLALLAPLELALLPLLLALPLLPLLVLPPLLPFELPAPLLPVEPELVLLPLLALPSWGASRVASSPPSSPRPRPPPSNPHAALVASAHDAASDATTTAFRDVCDPMFAPQSQQSQCALFVQLLALQLEFVQLTCVSL
jgi:hypothetical protein